MSLKNNTKAGLVLFWLFGLLPFLVAFVYAVAYSVGAIGILSNSITMEFWKQVFDSGELVKSFAYSSILAAAGVFFSVVIALSVSMGYRSQLRLPFWSSMIYFPLAIPGMVASFLTLQLFSKSGFFSRFSIQLGWIQNLQEFPDWINDRYGIGIVLTFVLVVAPFFIILFLNIYQNDRIDALSILAYSLGANKEQVFWKVTLPILLKRAKKIMILYFVFLLGAYEIPLVLGQESPQMISVLVIRELKQFDLRLIPEGYVIAVAYTLVIVTAAVIFFGEKEASSYD